ncbi:MAG: extracellular solute-binding protein [Planctomycetales bacterium]
MHAANSSRLHRSAIAGLLLAAAALAGCGPDDEESAAPFAGSETELLVPSGLGAETAWPRILDEWTARTGGKFRVTPYDAAPPRSSTTAARSAAAGIVVFPLAELPELVAAGMPTPIPAERMDSAQLAWVDVLPGLRESVGRAGGRPAVLPVACPVFVLYYRRDLLEKAGLSPPATWEDYAALVETLDRWAPGLVAVEPWGPNWRTAMFLARAVSYCRHPENYSVFFDVENAQPLIHGAGFVRALDEARNARIRLAPESLGYSPADCRREFFSGRAALAIAFELGPGQPTGSVPASGDAAAAERPPTMRAGFAPLPGVREVFYRSGDAGRWERMAAVHRVTLVGFAGLGAAVVGRGPPPAAWDLLRALTIDEVVSAFPSGARTPCRASQLAGPPSAWVGSELVGTEPAEYLSAVELSLRSETVVADLPIVERAWFRNALTIALDAALTGKATSSGALNAVAQRWGMLLEEHGPGRVLDSYRRSLGLRPLSTPDASPQ